MSTTEEVLEKVRDINPEAILWDGFNDCIIGLSHQGVVVYDQNLMVEKFMSENNTDVEEAVEYLEYNVFSTYVGEHTPIHVSLVATADALKRVQDTNINCY